MQDPLAVIAEFFQPNDEPWNAPTYPLEESPVAPLIGSVEIGGTTFFYCKLHPKFHNIHWDMIEHTIRFEKNRVMEHLEFLANYHQGKSQ